MSGLMRSEPMSYLQLMVPEEVVLAFCNELGHSSAMQFVDLNEGIQAFQRRYMKDIVRISDVERKVKNIEGYLVSHDIGYDDYLTESLIQPRQNERDIVDRLENEINQIYKGLVGDIKVENELTEDLKKAEDFEEVLARTEQFLGHSQEARVALHERKTEIFGDDGPSEDPQSYIMDQPLLNLEQKTPQAPPPQIGASGIAFKYFAGVVTDSQRPAFERQVYLASRGNTYSLFNDIPDKQKSTFIVFLIGKNLSEKLDRLCKFMNIEVFLTSETADDIEGQLQECRQHQADVSVLLEETQRGLLRNLHQVAKDVMDWRVALMQEKAIRFTLNRFKDSERAGILIAEGWCPTSKKAEVEEALNIATSGKGMAPSVLSDINWKGRPPTYFKLNKFTECYQNVVDTYGVPRYGEINPTIFTIITFPFLYAVMYGDVFHGACVTLYALYLIYNEKKMGRERLDDFVGSAFYGRYLLLLMGFFAIYVGFIYNDMASIPLHLFRSGWTYDGKTLDQGYPQEPGPDDPHPDIDVGQAVQQPHVYPFGADYAWYHSNFELAFFNGVKMKMSVILGVTQMTFGLFLSLANHIHFKDQISIWCEFVPQFIFMMCTFGYMCFLIIYKWVINWACQDTLEAPNIIAVMIDFVLSPGVVKEGAQIFPDKEFQVVLEIILLISALVSVPWMLFPKPILLKFKHDRKQKVLEESETMRSHISQPPVKGEAIKTSRGQSMIAYPKASRGISLTSEEGFRRRDSFVGEDDEPPRYGSTDRLDSLAIEEPVDTTLEMKKSYDHHEEEEFSFGEVFIHQIIHTIEYILGTISNTASYLRLWALSLAHAELSKVIFEQIMFRMLEDGSFYLIFFGAPAFFAVTFGVLLTMDVLECFLHALRLHWVEWQNKFYFADGEPFAPFSYRAVLEEERDG